MTEAQIDSLVVGSIVRSNRRMKRRVIPYRVVRSVSYKPDGRLAAVEFTKQRPSWTRRPLTTYMRTDLKQMGYVSLRQQKRLRSLMDRRIQKAVEAMHDHGHWTDLTERDVQGVW